MVVKGGKGQEKVWEAKGGKGPLLGRRVGQEGRGVLRVERDRTGNGRT